MSAVLPGATIGILGGGQLGRMTALAARSMGYGVRVMDPDPDCPARAVADAVHVARFDDAEAPARLARECAVVTLEIEQLAPEGLTAAACVAPVRPGAAAIATIRDRGRQKDWLTRAGLPLGPWRLATSAAQLAEAVGALGGACVAKLCVGGYDGRGQVAVASPADAAAAWVALGGRPVVVERWLALQAELSVLVARRPSGEIVVYPPALNYHEARVLAWSVIPGTLPTGVVHRAAEIAREAAERLAIEGLLAVEMFLLRGGELYVNELAPRPHNSFHATEMACATSQFEQHVRAVCDLPLGAVDVVRPAAIANLFGDAWRDGRAPAFDEALALPGVRLHLYGKREPRPGRKMGHLTATGQTAEEAVVLVRAALARACRGAPALEPA